MRKMAKPCSILAERFACTASISDDVPEQQVKDTLHFLKRMGISGPVPDHCETKDFYSYLVRGILRPLNIQRGRVTCLVSIKPAFINSFGGFHGGAIAAVAEAVLVATARTVVAEDKELFLGELLSISYLSSAPKNECQTCSTSGAPSRCHTFVDYFLFFLYSKIGNAKKNFDHHLLLASRFFFLSFLHFNHLYLRIFLISVHS